MQSAEAGGQLERRRGGGVGAGPVLLGQFVEGPCLFLGDMGGSSESFEPRNDAVCLWLSNNHSWLLR